MKVKIVLIVLLLFLPLLGACVNQARKDILPTGEWKVYYDTESVSSAMGIPKWGKAVAEGSDKVIGNAKVEEYMVKDKMQAVSVRETHYDAKGKKIYSALSYFVAPDGERYKTEEVDGAYVEELFPHWPMSSPSNPGMGTGGGFNVPGLGGAR